MRFVPPLLISMLASAGVLGIGAAVGFFLLVMLNGFSESQGAMILGAYAVVVIGLNAAIVTVILRAMLKQLSTPATIGIALALTLSGVGLAATALYLS